LGHLTRSCQLANGLFEVDPNVEFHFWTDFPAERLASELVMPFSCRRVAYEPGTAQKSCFELDVEQTVRDYRAFRDRADLLLEEEIEALRAIDCDAVVCDAPAILVRAAAELGIPVVAVSNFTWDWILETILEGTPAESMLDWLRESYGRGSHHIRLPFGPATSPFPSSEKGPLISRRSRVEPNEVMQRFGFERDGEKRIALVCPGGWDPDGWAMIHPDTSDFQLVLVGDLPVDLRPGDLSLPHALDPLLRFPDLVNMADVVLAKPGYGIASECVAHRTPLVTIDRPGFRETAVLRQELSEMGPCSELALSAFFSGSWSAALDRAVMSSTPWVPMATRPDLDLARSLIASL
jgi:hypothetical protein